MSNPTPRKCRGHRWSYHYTDNKCIKCGGVAEKRTYEIHGIENYEGEIVEFTRDENNCWWGLSHETGRSVKVLVLHAIPKEFIAI